MFFCSLYVCIQKLGTGFSEYFNAQELILAVIILSICLSVCQVLVPVPEPISGFTDDLYF